MLCSLVLVGVLVMLLHAWRVESTADAELEAENLEETLEMGES